MRHVGRILVPFAALLALLAGGPATGAARAEGDPAPGAAPVDTATWRLRAVDLTAQQDAMAAQGSTTPEVPLANRAIVAQVVGADKKPVKELTFRTGPDAAFEVPLAEIPKDGGLMLRIDPTEKDGDGWSGWLLPQIDPWSSPRATVAAFRRITTVNPIFAHQLIHVVRAIDVDKPAAYVRLQAIAVFQNDSNAFWLGDPADPARAALRMPIPAGFRVEAVEGMRGSLPHTVGKDASGRESLAISGAGFEPSAQPERVRVVMTGPWSEDGEYDLSFRPAYPLASYTLSIEEGRFSYVQDDVATTLDLTDGGAQAPMEGMNDVTTHLWTAKEIYPDTPVAVVFAVGHRLHARVILTLSVLGFALVGAILLGRSLAKRTPPVGAGPASPPPPVASRDDPAVVAARIRELEKAHARGEMTEFELRARKAALTGAAKSSGQKARTSSHGTAGGATAASSPSVSPASTSGASTAVQLAEDLRRAAGTASPEELRRAVATLADLVGDLARGADGRR